MNRLTSIPQASMIKCCGCIEESNCYSDISCNEIFEGIKKLKAYEDTGLEPEEITCCINLLRGKCWACSNARAYRIGSRTLKSCDYMKGCIAATGQPECENWTLDKGCLHQPGQQEGEV